MNAQLQESTDIAVIPPKPPTVIERALSVFSAILDEQSLRELAQKSASITEITNEAGKDQCHAARMVLKNTRLEIARVGEEGREDAVQTSKAIIARQKALISITKPEEDRLDAIQEAWDKRIAAEKEAKIQAEIARVASLQERVAELRGCQTLSPSSGSALIAEHIDDVKAIVVDQSFEEFEQQASDAKIATIFRLTAIFNAALAHEAEQAKIIADRAELARLQAAEADRQEKARTEEAERDLLAKIETDRLAKEAAEKRAAEAREQAEANRLERERIAKVEADAKAIRDAAAKADEENRRRNEAALQEIQAIQHQLIIADTGRRPYCNGGDLASIDFAIDGTEKWELTEERFGALFSAAVKTKETTLEALRAKRVDFLTRQANAEETARLATQQAEITRQQEELRKANEPKSVAPDAPIPAPVRATERPTAKQLVALVASHYSVSLTMAAKWIQRASAEIEAAK